MVGASLVGRRVLRREEERVLRHGARSGGRSGPRGSTTGTATGTGTPPPGAERRPSPAVCSADASPRNKHHALLELD